MSTDPVEVRETIAAAVRAEIARAGLTQRDVARALGMTHAYLWRRTHGEVGFAAEELVTIADHLDIPVETFYSGIGEVEPT